MRKQLSFPPALSFSLFESFTFSSSSFSEVRAIIRDDTTAVDLPVTPKSKGPKVNWLPVLIRACNYYEQCFLFTAIGLKFCNSPLFRGGQSHQSALKIKVSLENNLLWICIPSFSYISLVVQRLKHKTEEGCCKIKVSKVSGNENKNIKHNLLYMQAFNMN